MCCEPKMLHRLSWHHGIASVASANETSSGAVCGRHADTVCELLHSGGLSCKALDSTEYAKCMLEKLIWIRYDHQPRPVP